jgi:hypothetical protein
VIEKEKRVEKEKSRKGKGTRKEGNRKGVRCLWDVGGLTEE